MGNRSLISQTRNSGISWSVTGSKISGRRLLWWPWNCGMIPCAVALSIHCKSFSTWGPNVIRLGRPGKSHDDDFAIIHDALNHHHFVLFKKQQDPSPRAQYELTERFDPASEEYGHDKTADNYIHGYFMGIPNQPQVQIKGHGFIKSFMGLQDIKLRHPHHSRTYSEVISEDQGDDAYTRFNRWNIDAGLYDLNPPKVTTLMAVQVPKCRRQTILYDDGYGEKLTAPLNMLSPEDQEFFRTSKAEYAPHPYNWVKPAKMHPTGLSVYTEGREKPESKLPPIDPSKIQILPMAWKNPVTGKLSLQVHPAPIRKIHCADGSIIDILKEVRDLMYRLQRPAISPQYVYAHDWEEGDMVLFNNHGVSHTVVGSLKPDDIRVFRQCNLAASEPPEGP